ncbi:DUF6248 family natural product biosynthesis protein [Nonomuraea sp. NPDC049784]|uniref:DUF6248 family natural product biosynthesis protein n=1 Tax=Nonomuraea sp. NPDC049784 TaxID=3154361 RepID=UPI0033FD3129
MSAHPRAGKRPGEVDWEHVSKTPLLRLHGALILGIVDPILMTSPMREEEGAWVRAHAWTRGIRAVDDVYPYGFWRWCSCQSGTCWNCLSKRCDLCVHRQAPPKVDSDAGAITDRKGYVVALIIHRPEQRPCRWVCKCPHRGGVAPVVQGRRRALVPITPRQDALFDMTNQRRPKMPH